RTWRARLHEHARLMRDGETLIERCPVWATRYLVTITALECEFARRRMLSAHLRDRRPEVYREGLAFILFYKVLLSIARSLGHSGVCPQKSLLPVVDEGGQLDEESARGMLRAGFEQMQQAPEGWTTLQHLLLTDQGVSSRDRNEAVAALEGLVRGKISNARIGSLSSVLKREGHHLAGVLGGAAFEALMNRRPGEGLDAVRSQAVNALRREFYNRKSAALVEGSTRAAGAEHELAAFAEQEHRTQAMARLKRMAVEAGLSPNQREVFLMVSEGLSEAEIAQRTERKPNQVYQEKHQALKKIRRHPDLPALRSAVSQMHRAV
ncbi:MAG: hypothetical protein AVDCRST_MAG93-4909, partial [uncultured Chloroflexia bacterium]